MRPVCMLHILSVCYRTDWSSPQDETQHHPRRPRQDRRRPRPPAADDRPTATLPEAARASRSSSSTACSSTAASGTGSPSSSRAGLRCLVPDWPMGSHRIAMKPGRRPHPPRHGGDRSPPSSTRSGSSGATVVGNDSGGAISQILAAEPPRAGRAAGADQLRHVRALPAVSVQPDAADRAAARRDGGAGGAVSHRRRRAGRRTRLLAKHPIPPELVDDWLAPDARATPASSATCASSPPACTSATRSRRPRSCAAFERPVRFAWAPEDRFFKLADAERLAGDGPRRADRADRGRGDVRPPRPARARRRADRRVRRESPEPRPSRSARAAQPPGRRRQLDGAAGDDAQHAGHVVADPLARGSRPRPRPCPPRARSRVAGPSEASTSCICSLLASSSAVKRSTPSSRARSASSCAECRAEAPALPLVDHGHRGLGAGRRRRAGRSGRRRPPPPVRVERDQRLVVVVVDLGQVAQLRLGELGDRGQEALVARLLAEPVERGDQRVLVGRLDRAHEDARSRRAGAAGPASPAGSVNRLREPPGEPLERVERDLGRARQSPSLE